MMRKRDFVSLFESETETEKENKASSTSKRFSDFISSFCEMGYDKKSVIKVIDALLEENQDKYNSLDDREIEKSIFTSVLRRLN